jgi:hypothetical protein
VNTEQKSRSEIVIRTIRIFLMSAFAAYLGSELLTRYFDTIKPQVSAEAKQFFTDSVKLDYLMKNSKKFAMLSKPYQDLNILAFQKTKLTVLNINEVKGVNRLRINIEQPDIVSPTESTSFKIKTISDALLKGIRKESKVIMVEAIRSALINEEFSLIREKLEILVIKGKDNWIINEEDYIKQLEKFIYSN